MNKTVGSNINAMPWRVATVFAVAAVVVFYLRELEFRPGKFMNLFLSLDAPDMASVKWTTGLFVYVGAKLTQYIL